MIVGPVLFAAPWLLVALAGLPLLYWLLRVTPPAPRTQSFPPARLLRDLPPVEETPARTPWWLLLLRLAAAALLILGLARPVWDAARGTAAGETGPLLVVLEDGWASGGDWPDRVAVARAAMEAAGREGRTVALLGTAATETGEPPRATPPLPVEEARGRLAAWRPKPWPPDRAAAAEALAAWRTAHSVTRASVLLVGDGVAQGAAGDGALWTALSALGPVTAALREAGSSRPTRVLLPPRAEADRLLLAVAQTPVAAPTEVAVLARTADGRTLARAVLRAEANATGAEGALELPVEVRNTVTRLDLEESAGGGAAGTVLLDERFRHRPVGLIAGEAASSADAALTGPLYYLERALAPYAEVRRGASPEALLARRLAVLVLADRPLAEGRETDLVSRFVQDGGLLLRFAGPRTAERPDALLPVQLRAGERQIGGSLSWEQPQRLAPFAAGSPFAGLPVPPEVTVTTQVLAEPAPRLAERTWARLADGTPLVTGESRGAGRVVLFHVTANADWSDLALSGLFVDMLRRLVSLSAGVVGAEGDAPLAPLESLDGFGRLGPPPPAAAAIPANAVAEARPGPRSPPGWYGTAGEGGERRALNLSASLPVPPRALAPPEGARVVPLGGVPAERDLGPWLLAAALLLLAADLLLSLRQRGLGAIRSATPAARAVGLALLLAAAPLAAALAQPPEPGAAALATRLAYVETGDATADETSRMGLLGLSDYVNRRTAVALADPAGVRPGADDLSFYPLLYWPVLPGAPALDARQSAAMNEYMRLGGIVLFDTRDEGSGAGTAQGAAAALRRVTRDLAVPPLAPVAEDHVLKRAFYLLPELPGRWAGGTVWVARDVDRANDSVSGVIVGGHDWAAAWAVDGRGANPHAVVPGGARQRTLAYRFGVNLVVYALTGNYKGDQVHVPAILERLGN